MTSDKLSSRRLFRFQMFIVPVLAVIVVLEGVLVASMAQLMDSGVAREAEWQRLLNDSLGREKAGLAREADLRGMLEGAR